MYNMQGQGLTPKLDYMANKRGILPPHERHKANEDEATRRIFFLVLI